MTYYLIALFVFAYVWWVMTDQIGIIARASGCEANLISYGITLHNQIMSINRFGGFLLGPILGLLIIESKSTFSLLVAGFLGSFFGSLSLIVINYHKNWFVSKFVFSMTNAEKNGYKFIKIVKDFSNRKIRGIKLHKNKKNRVLIFMSMYIYTLTGLSFLLINLLAVMWPAYSPVILQLTSLVSGLGNLIYNFKLMPKLSDLDVQKRNGGHYSDVLLGKMYSQFIVTLFLFIGLVLA